LAVLVMMQGALGEDEVEDQDTIEGSELTAAIEQIVWFDTGKRIGVEEFNSKTGLKFSKEQFRALLEAIRAGAKRLSATDNLHRATIFVEGTPNPNSRQETTFSVKEIEIQTAREGEIVPSNSVRLIDVKWVRDENNNGKWIVVESPAQVS